MQKQHEDELKYINLDEIIVNPEAMRDAQVDDDRFKELCDSIARSGVKQPINVYKDFDANSGKEKYVLINGVQRFSASQKVGKTKIPAQISTKAEADALAQQIVQNAVNVPTTKTQYAKGLQNMLRFNPTYGSLDLAKFTGKSVSWVLDQLRLNKLPEAVQKLVDSGDIKVAHAVSLSKLPEQEMLDSVELAMTTTIDVFKPMIEARVKELAAAKKEGRAAQPRMFTANRALRRLSEISAEMDSLSTGRTLVTALIEQAATDPHEALVQSYKIGLQFATNTDAPTLESRRQEWEKKESETKAKAEARKLEKEQKKAEDAKKKADAALAA